MRKIFLFFIVGLFFYGTSFADCEKRINGVCLETMKILQYDGIGTAPSVSKTGTARQYFDTASGKLKCSENGGAYEDCGAGAEGGASTLGDLSDVGSTTYTAGRILVGDGDSFESVAISGDASLSSSGTVILQDLQRGFGIDQPSSTLDVAKTVFIPTVPITISGMKCISLEGTSTAVKLTDGTNDMTTVTCGTTVTGATFSSNNTFSANEPVKFTVTGVTGTVTYFYGQFTYERTP